MYLPLKQLKENSKGRKELKNFLQALEKKKVRGIDALARKINDQVFREIDCLQCANCC